MSGLASPALVISVLLGVAYAAAFHFWRGRTVRDFFIYLATALLGFGAGQLIGAFTQIGWLEIGEVHVVEATIGAWAALFAVHLAMTPAAQRS